MESKEIIGKQIKNFLESTTDAIMRVSYLLSQIDLPYHNFERSKFSFHAVAKLQIYRMIKGFVNYPAMINYLQKHHETQQFEN